MFLGKVVSSGKIELPCHIDHLRGESKCPPRTDDFDSNFFHVSKKYKAFEKNNILEIFYRESSDSRLIITKVKKSDCVWIHVAREKSDFAIGKFLHIMNEMDLISPYSERMVNFVEAWYQGDENDKIVVPSDFAFKLCEVFFAHGFNYNFFYESVNEKEKDVPIKVANHKDNIATYGGIWIDNKWIPEDVVPLVTALEMQRDSGDPINILATGESGYGKTTLFEIMAKRLGMDFLRINCATVIDTESWFGYQEARDGDTVFLPTDFSNAVIEGNCLIVLDEANRIEPWIANSLFPILDYARETTVHGEHIVVGPNVIFGLTMNIGSQFSGTYTYDQAMKNRIDAFIEINEPPFAIEKEIIKKRYPDVDDLDIQKILLVLKALRSDKLAISANVSTRTALKIARLISYKMNVKDAMFFSLVNSAEEIDKKEIIDIINMKIGVD
jgi:hypothetical protein